MRSLSDRPVILAEDISAKSALWFSNHTDRRGEEVEAFPAAHDLIVVSEEGNLATFSTYSERIPGSRALLLDSNIDITLRNSKARVWGWRVQDEGNSDHQLIVFNFGGNSRKQGLDSLLSNKDRLIVRYAD